MALLENIEQGRPYKGGTIEYMIRRNNNVYNLRPAKLNQRMKPYHRFVLQNPSTCVEICHWFSSIHFNDENYQQVSPPG